MARLPAATALLLLLPSLCCTDATDPTSVSMPAQAPTISTTKTPVLMPNAATGVTEPTTETSSKGMTNTNTPGLLALTSSTTSGSAGSTAHGVTKEESVTTEVTLATSSSAIPTSRSSRNATENQSSIKTTETSVNTQQPDQSPSEATVLPSTSTTSENVSQFQGMEDGKNTSSLSTSPSYSSIILPVVIVLIVITLSVFVLVGLYRMCQKKDPGTPENGSDQPQSDKESVKLLTVKTISHESGERCAPEKTKN